MVSLPPIWLPTKCTKHKNNTPLRRQTGGSHNPGAPQPGRIAARERKERTEGISSLPVLCIKSIDGLTDSFPRSPNFYASLTIFPSKEIKPLHGPRLLKADNDENGINQNQGGGNLHQALQPISITRPSLVRKLHNTFHARPVACPPRPSFRSAPPLYQLPHG